MNTFFSQDDLIHILYQIHVSIPFSAKLRQNKKLRRRSRKKKKKKMKKKRRRTRNQKKKSQERKRRRKKKMKKKSLQQYVGYAPFDTRCEKNWSSV